MLTSQNFGSYVTGVAFHPTKNLVASCSLDKSIKLWNADTGAELWTVSVDAGRGGVRSVSFSPSGDMVAAGCYNGKIHFMDAAAGQIKSSVNVGYAFSRCSTRISLPARPLFSRFSTRISVQNYGKS